MQTIKQFKEEWNIENSLVIAPRTVVFKNEVLYKILYEMFFDSNFMEYLHKEVLSFEVYFDEKQDGCRWADSDGKYYLQVFNRDIQKEYSKRITKFEIFYMENYDCQ
jgi:hypothetical protein